jgi:Putative abortive phage resistance protein AbiGi, antitoxin
MAVSSKSIIHYTNSLKNIKGIIQDEGLRLKYCKENLIFSDDFHFTIAFPMVCFCDLPLSLAKEHIVKYGSYGIGFTKEWARRNQLNPVLYIEKDSILSLYLSTQTDDILKPARGNTNLSQEESNAILDAMRRFSHILGFCKNHVGPLSRRGKKTVEDYVFYDEREWRYLPPKEILGDKEVIVAGPLYEKNRKEYNDSLENTSLEFNHNDLSYIIVKSEKEKSEIVDFIRAKYYKKLTNPELNNLYTKIISVKQINDDF